MPVLGRLRSNGLARPGDYVARLFLGDVTNAIALVLKNILPRFYRLSERRSLGCCHRLFDDTLERPS